MATELKGTIEETTSLWEHFHRAVEDLGEFANQVERTLAPTAKQQYLQTLQIGETLQQLHFVNDRIAAKIEERNRLGAALAQAKGGVDEARALVIISGVIDGKNAEIRDAQLLLALKNEPGYVEARAQVEGVERAIAALDADLESLRGQQGLLKVKARIIAAQLEYLAEGR